MVESRLTSISTKVGDDFEINPRNLLTKITPTIKLDRDHLDFEKFLKQERENERLYHGKYNYFSYIEISVGSCSVFGVHPYSGEMG